MADYVWMKKSEALLAYSRKEFADLLINPFGRGGMETGTTREGDLYEKKGAQKAKPKFHRTEKTARRKDRREK